MQDFDRTIISQYSNSPALTQWITNINAVIDPTYDLENFYDLIWNIQTAQGYGLDVWGRIVGIGRVLAVSATPFFGYTGPLGHSGDSFTAAPFYEGEPTTTNYSLTDEAYRQLILAKAAANITNGSIQAINQILMNLFAGRGNAYVIDNGDMTMVYKFNFHLEPFEVTIVQGSGVLPTPAGVLFTVSFP